MKDYVVEAIAGINRFYGEGYTKWPQSQLVMAFGGRSLRTKEIDNTLLDLERSGFIRLHKQVDCYLEVLQKIVDFP